MTTTIKELVSKKKRRFVQDGFNLDLTYISDRVIAMGFPATSVEAMYRNNMDDVRKMLEQKHKDHYKLYNLCSEKSYDPQKFQGVWLNEDEKNVAVVHCKAGKGRTGLMICAYLLHSRKLLSAEEVLSFYGLARTHDEKGVTIPSQRRYVDYYAAMINENLQYSPVKLYLYSFVIDPLPALSLGLQQDGYIQFEVRQTRVRPFTSEVYQVKRTDGRINIVLPQPLLIVGDVKIEFIQKNDVFNFGKGKGRKFMTQTHKLFHFWLNTFFIDLERCSPLTHEITEPSPEELFHLSLAPICRSSALTHESLSARPSLPVKPPEQPGDRNCRSTHNSGGNGVAPEQLPPPRQLRSHLSTGSEPHTPKFTEVEDLEPRSPNGSCLASMQTIHSHPPARTVSIIEPIKQRAEVDCDRGVKLMSISDDTLTEGGHEETTHSSFNSKRTRHSSVPMTSKSGLSHQQTRFTRTIPGKLMSVRLKKNQIDNANKDKFNTKFSDNFNVTLFLVRPTDQTLQDEFSRSNLICQHAEGVEGGYTDVAPVDCWSERESSDEDQPREESGPAEVFNDENPRLHPGSAVELAPRTEPPVLHGMVRNRTEPSRPLAFLTPVTGPTTWI
ncbi:cyclin-G-associated kinase [Eurytemora carolleeae]|uniref:cyclin-G-associated kinase n=1 Tax=Eurytemora carolleeae TaxID=1294199 RepID=UPI000C78DC23|nr:cyclin-G-associated kinase [Eurytemora carolleeae]|eukprot:XP_023331913.1 cyclin-G-associated kinase-like [Eurytemora affinis]